MNFNINTDTNETTFEDLRDLYEITESEQIIDLLGDIIILDRFKSNFDYLYNRVVDIAALCWNNKDDRGNKLQNTVIKFKITFEDVTVYATTLNRFMMSLCFIKPLLQYLNDIDIEEFILKNAMTEKLRRQMMKRVVHILSSYGHTIKEIQVIMARLSLDLKELLLVFAKADIQIYTAENLFLDHYRDSEIVREINNTEYPPHMQTSEIIEENKRRYAILEKEMLRLGNPFFKHNHYTKIVKPKQMEELYINFAQIPDGENIVPVIMNGNGFRAGYNDMAVLYAGAIAARVPDMLNKKYMGTAGYFNRNLMILTYGTISRTVFDCGSVNKIRVYMDEMELYMKVGRYYSTTKESEVLHVLHETDTHLLGKTLWFRSPCTCNLNEDVCHVCYGSKALRVGDLKGGFICTTEVMTSRVSKNVLSAKHAIQANAEKIIFTGNFDKYFIIDSSSVYPNPDEKRFDIYIREDYRDNMFDSLTLYIGKGLIPLTISHYSSINIPDHIIDNLKDVEIDDVKYHKINSKKVLDLGGELCSIIPINIMMTAKYQEIMKLFESDISRYETIDEVVLVLTKLFYKTIPLLSTHGELILSKLLRDVDNRILRPNFLIPDVPYQMLKLKTALKYTESATVALAFEHPKYHLLNAIFDERNDIKRVGPRSFADYLFGYEYS